MTITTEEALRRADVLNKERRYKSAEAIRSLAAERDALKAENARLRKAPRLGTGRTTRKCVNAHDRCYGGDGGPCDYCEIVEETQ